MFYLKWIEPIMHRGHKVDAISYWVNKSNSASYHSWAGYTFEGICLKHAHLIKKAMRLDKISFETGSWRFVPAKGVNAQGAQIDLLFDRDDGVINICEIKYAPAKFKIDKAYAKTLTQKMDAFETHYKTKKQIFVTMISTYGLEDSIWSQELVHTEVTMDALFKA